MFTIRKSVPKAGNKCYMTKSSGGWSLCIVGKPTLSGCNVLANCVGYACGRFNEIYNEIMHFSGMKYNKLNCNANDFIVRAKEMGLQISNIPTIGGIMVWDDSKAGHVAVVERINEYDKEGKPLSIYLSESGYNSSYFWNSTRENKNDRWGAGSNYKFIGCIINPSIKKTITPNVKRDVYANQIEVKVSDLRVRTNPGLNGEILGYAKKGYYNFYSSRDIDNYKWYEIGDNNWIASKKDWTVIYPKKGLKYQVGDKMILNGYLYRDSKGNGKGALKKNFNCTITKTCDTPGTTKPYNVNNGLGWVSENDLKPRELKVGDTVKIIGTGNGSCDGKSNIAYGIGLKRKILKIYYGSKYPYQVGNEKSTIGFYQASSLEII